ncbi:MAG TPA: inositol monophosphatase family protein [Candidatus Saccharimonadales bacterium]|nr:inositol monophosphatase family protein [Candidatus Saccharimonadales bacterium]
MKYDKELKQALRLADKADEIALKYYRSRDLIIETKPDDSPVTQGDKEVEKALSKIVTDEYGDSYVGEEGTVSGTSSKRWLVDPIDGTKNFLRGFPIWGSLISLKVDDEVIVACISAPALNRRWWATKGNGAFTKDADGSERRINVSKVNDISNSFLLHNAMMTWDKTNDTDKVLALLRKTWRQRHVGDFLAFLYVSEGVADGCFDNFPALWDIEAAQLVVEEAGGEVWTSATDKTPIDARRHCVASNGNFTQTIIDALGLKKQ